VVPLTELRPTQFTVGMLAVSHQTKKINKMAKYAPPHGPPFAVSATLCGGAGAYLQVRCVVWLKDVR
jgi:hypothetical protein